ncbi:MAG: chemotaxis protein CheC [Candidatus Paceibacterota bacterium]|jgi:chemotaxis protein CheC
MGNEEEEVSTSHLDVLREIGTMGAGRAATALSEIINTTVEISVPEAKLIPAAQFASIVSAEEKTSFVLVIVLEGELGGRVFFLLSPHEARMLGAMLLCTEPDKISFEDAMFQSSIKEALNIIVGAYMAALSELTGYEIMFSVPYLALDVLTAVFIAEQTPQRSADMICIKTQLKIRGSNFDGAFVFFPDLPSIKKIFKALRLEETDRHSKPA